MLSLIVGLIVLGVAPFVRAEQVSVATAPLTGVESGDARYTLGTGDKVRVKVFGEDDLGGEFSIDDAGVIRLPLIGQVPATGRTVRQLEGDIAGRLGARYLKDPRVSVEVVNHRPFYIMGEVNKPGEYSFVTGMSVLNAVAMAGGFTYRANESSVYIRRKGADDEEKYPADATTKVQPGDIVNIVERWF